MNDRVFNVKLAGLGGQGVITASDILAEAAFQAGLDVKKSELHGMSQRGGSVSSDVRFGPRVLSPMIPDGTADWLLVFADDQVETNRYQLRPGGVLITPEVLAGVVLPSAKSINVALLGVLSTALPFRREAWTLAVRCHLPEKLQASSLAAFDLGGQTVVSPT